MSTNAAQPHGERDMRKTKRKVRRAIAKSYRVGFDGTLRAPSIAAGRTESFEDVESLIASLDGDDDNAQRDMPSLPRKR